MFLKDINLLLQTLSFPIPAVDSGVKQAQVFVGRDSLVADAYPMKSGKQIC